ncbi:MAG: CHAT domain-containing protein [Cytophaga sp.]|uniref:CHAT domain-containing protein n=1 Tax=Cytophaga sp. TaxID=29535 RepID=UPI003F805AC7
MKFSFALLYKFFLIIILTNLSFQTIQAQDSVCFNQAMALYTKGNYADAYKGFSTCLKNTNVKGSEFYNNCLLQMGICALENAAYKQASSLLHMAERALKDTSDNYIICKQKIAALHKRLGDYNEAETILLNLLNMQENSSNTNCALKAVTLNDLGVIYKRLGQYDRSINYLSESLQLKQSCLNPEDPSITISLNNLAGVYMKQKDYTRADSLYTTSIKIKTKLYGPDHPSTLLAWNNLAELYRQQNNYAEALTILQEVLARKAATSGTHTLSYAASLHTIANVYFASGKYAECINYCHKSIAIKEQLIGKHAANTMHSYVLLAKANHISGKNKHAKSLYDFILKTRQEEIDAYFKYLGEEEKIQYLKASNTYWKEFTAFVFDMNSKPQKHTAANSSLFNQWIENRWYLSELILEETQRQHRLWENISDTSQLKLVRELKELKDEIAEISLLKTKEDLHTSDELNDLTDRAAHIEKELTSIYAIENRKKYSVKDVTNALNSTECIIEIIKPIQTSGKYLALVYLQGIKTPYQIWLPEASVLEDKAYAYYRNNIKFKLQDVKSYNLYWKPIADFISAHSAIHTLYLVRDGIYECMNIHTLLADSTSITIIYLNKAESILSHKQRSKTITLNKTAFIYHPLYSSTIDACDYSDLPGTKTEVDSIENLFRNQALKTVRYGEAMASEAIIKNDTAAYSLVHIATHGYLEINPEDDYVESMIHSGLVLSGVCDPLDVDSTADDDGILTAYEIAQLNLSATDLVVLSACQSGLGMMDSQEGLVGLQRGLLVAGTKNVLVSLWKIDDAVTARWMIHFYSNLLETKSCTEAYLFAQQKIKEQYVYPYYWGAFVLLEQ